MAMTTSIRRRTLLKAGAGSFVGGVLASRPVLAGPPQAFISGIRDPKIAARSPGEGFGAAAFTAAGALLWQAQLPARSHGQAMHPRGEQVVVFARRPGDYAALIAARTGKVQRLIAPAKGRVFQGHGTFSPGGKRLYTSENAFEQGAGVIGIYDGQTFERLGEWPTGGIGVHEILMLGKGHLAIANGGILTHPGMPRKKLNLSTMRSSISLLATATGTISGVFELPTSATNQQLSLRHLALHPSGKHLAIAAQHQQKLTSVPLLYALDLGQRNASLRPLPLPAAIQEPMQGYCGSVAFSPCGRWLYGSSPKGGLIAALPFLTNSSSPAALPLPDGCGIASNRTCSGGQTVFTSGSGAIVAAAPGSVTPFPNAAAGTKKEDRLPLSLPLQFDNHAAPLA